MHKNISANAKNKAQTWNIHKYQLLEFSLQFLQNKKHDQYPIASKQLPKNIQQRIMYGEDKEGEAYSDIEHGSKFKKNHWLDGNPSPGEGNK